MRATTKRRGHTLYAANSHSLHFILSLIAFSVLGVLLIGLANSDDLVTLAKHTLRDMGIALCVSVIVALLIELSLSRDMFVAGLDAIMKRTVPADVWEEFRAHVITQELMRKNFNLTITFSTDDSGELVLLEKVTYTIIALQSVKKRIKHSLDQYRTPPRLGAYYTRAHCGMKDYADSAALEKSRIVGSDKRRLAFKVNLAKDETMDISIEFKEIVKPPDTIGWWMSLVTQDAAVTIAGLPADWVAEIEPHHPAPEQLKKTDRKHEWHFKGIMMPGQGFGIRIREAKPQHRPVHVSGGA